MHLVTESKSGRLKLENSTMKKIIFHVHITEPLHGRGDRHAQHRLRVSSPEGVRRAGHAAPLLLRLPHHPHPAHRAPCQWGGF